MKISHVLIAFTLFLVPLASNASPAADRLLAMVPENAQIVSGMKLTLAAEAKPQLSVVVHNNNVDFNDWLALVSVDPEVSGRNIVEVAASSPRGELAERLLLVDGTFDARHIERAAIEAGASAVEFAGIRVLIVLPFAREGDDRVGVRWLAVPDDRTALFGTPLLVQEALTRRATHAQTNAALVAHLGELRPGADDWSIVTMPPDVFKRHLGNACYAAEAIQALTQPYELVMGFVYGHKTTTINFVALTKGDLSEKDLVSSAHAQFLATTSNRVRLERVAVEGRWVIGTLTELVSTGNDNTRELANR